MDIDLFEQSLAQDAPPAMPALATALWWDAKGNWERAHEVAQDIESRDAAWVHAYLHRREGDLANAGYWYRRAGKPMSHDGLDEERREIVTELLKD